MKSHTTLLAIIFGFLSIHFFYESKIILNFLILISGVSLISKSFSDWIEKIWNFISKVLSYIVPNIVLSLIFFLLLVPLSFFSKAFKSKTEYNTKNNSDTNFIISNKVYSKKFFERAW